MDRRELKPPRNPEQEFIAIKNQVIDLAKEAIKKYPQLDAGFLPEKIMELWRSRPEGADQINLISVSISGEAAPILCFEIGFYRERKEILIPLEDL